MQKSIIISSLLITTFFTSCKKDDDSCSAGLGGSLTVAAFPQHHTKSIFNLSWYPDTVYVKFNTQDAPGISPSNFDTFFVGEEGEDHVHLEGLKCGDYFFYAAGYDTTINQRVVGGVPFTTDQSDGELDLNIPVTE